MCLVIYKEQLAAILDAWGSKTDKGKKSSGEDMGQAIPAMKMNRGRVIRMFNDRNRNVNSFFFTVLVLYSAIRGKLP